MTDAALNGANKSGHQIPGYQILSRLGRGGMATVYKAKQLSLDRIVAIKVLPKESTTRKEFVDRFYAEGRAAAKLNHPNIVGAIDVGKSGEFYYFVMEYIEGQTVFDAMNEVTRFDEEDALNILIDVSRGLEHAHESGIVHRDIKPQNIMLSKNGPSKILDLGLARDTDQLELNHDEKGKAFGSPYYISPEQIRASPHIDKRADYYAFGATAYSMVTGRVPYDGNNAQEVMKKHLKEPLVSPKKLNPKISDGLEAVITVCLAKDAKDRYENTAQLTEDLVALRNGEAPLHAETKLESQAPTKAEERSKTKDEDPGQFLQDHRPPITEETMFWPAIGGWVLATLFLLLWLSKVLGG
jgi:eukaryotic-like serine/threonine-protein kinase